MDDRQLVSEAVSRVLEARAEDTSVRRVSGDAIGVDVLCDVSDLPPPFVALVRDIVSLYCTRSKIELHKVLMSRYSDAAVFSDNLVLTANLDNIRACFLGVQLLVDKVEPHVTSTRLRFVTRPSAPDTVELDIHAVHRVHWAWFFLPRYVLGGSSTLQVTSTLTLNSKGKVVAHRDRIKPLISLPGPVRLLVGLTTPLLTTFLNW